MGSSQGRSTKSATGSSTMAEAVTCPVAVAMGATPMRLKRRP